MKRFIIYLLILFVGILIGSSYIWISTYSDTSGNYSENKIELEEVLKYSNTQIKDDNFSCEGETAKTVGAVVGSIYNMNNHNIRNMVSFGCYNNTCSLSISDCKPWQSQECGSRHLVFEINNEKEIDSTTFKCFDVP
ncbi:MAG: hypothetical protein GY756_20680 [bacterium]|nr:hypothetical protein [bacterium]